MSIEEMYKTLPAGKRLTLKKAKYSLKLEKCHKYLKMRDDVFLMFSDLTAKLRKILLDIGNDLVNNSMLTDPSDIFYFELKEVKNILGDEFYGNIPFTLNFRKWQNSRFAALCMPSIMYERDVEQCENLSIKQIDKSEHDKTVPCFSIGSKEITTENYALKDAFRLSDISSIDGSDIIIAESASLLSFTAEYTIVNDIPLYTGARFANLLLKDKTIKTSENCISYE